MLKKMEHVQTSECKYVSWFFFPHIIIACGRFKSRVLLRSFKGGKSSSTLACCKIAQPQGFTELLLRCCLGDVNLVAQNQKGYFIQVLIRKQGIQAFPCFCKPFSVKCIHQVYYPMHLQFNARFFRSWS